MTDILLERAFADKERWQYAITKGLGKGICKKDVRELCDERTRVNMYLSIKNGLYEISPPHTAKIPKDDGTFRTVFINEPKDRILLSLINDLLFEMMPELIHKSCKSYQKGMSCSRVVKALSKEIVYHNTNETIGWKADLSKYFDSVPIEYIDAAFDSVELKYGNSALIDVVRKYYHNDWYFDEHNNLQKKYQSLKQGCAVAAWLADVVLYGLDATLSMMDGVYVRYSDDIVFAGSEYNEAMCYLQAYVTNMGMSLNPKKIEYIDRNHWFKFLGFSIKGEHISLSNTGIKKFQKAIEDVTIKKRGIKYKDALRSVHRVLYKGYNGYSWAKRLLRTINVESDIDTLNKFVMDCLRAVQTGKKKVGGLGYVRTQKDGCIARGTGKNVKANRQKMPDLEGYYTIRCMRNGLLTSNGLYDTIVRVNM